MIRLLLCLVVFIVLLLVGCGAVYRYERTAEGCRVAIYSARDVQAGDLTIDQHCAVTGGADSLTHNDKALDALRSLIERIH